ncbi:MAG: hypothetical protein ACLUVF_02385 [Adlercreutzia sp.]
MREEDEIRAAVIELARAQAAGEDIADALPHGEALATAGAAADGEVADDALDPEQARREAILAVLDVVRAASRESLLSCPCEWEAAGLVPPSMMPEDLEMAVYDALMEFGDPNGSREAAGVGGPDAGAAPRRAANKHVKSAFSSSNGRPVGASPFKHKKPRADDPAMGDVKGLAGALIERVPQRRTAQWAVPPSEDCLSESGYPPAPPQETSNQIPEEDPHPEFAHIRLLMGAESYYLYDDSAMTDAYARWAFLAAEDDPVATFIECVREESSVYPRPMARESLANDPFRMKAEAVEAAFAEARAQGRADDIERVEASNGDVYFYSTTYLTPRRAQALAEWDAVERIRNV